MLGPFERFLYRIFGANPTEGQDWKRYARSLVFFSLIGWLVMYAILRTQTLHPWSNYPGVQYHSGTWDVTFNTVSSFVTNTNWQYYGGETTLTYFSQMMGMTVQNFVSAAVGICVLIALIRGIIARSGSSLGNFWQDLVRTVLYVLLPLSVLGTLLLVSQGVIQNLGHYTTAHTIAGGTQTLAQGPVASQIAIKQLGTNGGGFFNTNSAYPFENATPFSNFVEMLYIILIPAALTYTYGRLVGSRRQGWAIFAAMFVLYAGATSVAYWPSSTARRRSTRLASDGRDHRVHRREHGGQGAAQRRRELRAVGTTTSGHLQRFRELRDGVDDRHRLGRPLTNLGESEVVFGGVGTGLYSMLVFVLLAVFIGGLMVGRTPEYLGKKIGAKEIKLVSLAALFTPLTVLMTTGVAVASPLGRKSIDFGGPQGFSEIPLRVYEPGQQQRLGVRRLHRLHPAQRRQPRRPRREDG